MSKSMRPIKRPKGNKNTSHCTNHGKKPHSKWVTSGLVKPILKDEKQQALSKARKVRAKARRIERFKEMVKKEQVKKQLAA